METDVKAGLRIFFPDRAAAWPHERLACDVRGIWQVADLEDPVGKVLSGRRFQWPYTAKGYRPLGLDSGHHL